MIIPLDCNPMEDDWYTLGADIVVLSMECRKTSMHCVQLHDEVRITVFESIKFSNGAQNDVCLDHPCWFRFEEFKFVGRKTLESEKRGESLSPLSSRICLTVTH